MFYAKGYNKYQVYRNISTIHAEVDAIRNLKPTRKPKSISLVVYRTNHMCNFMMARPCARCISKIFSGAKKKNYNVKHIYYTDDDGDFIKF